MCTVYDTATEIRNVILGGGSVIDVMSAMLKGVVVGFMCKIFLGIVLKPMMAIFGLVLIGTSGSGKSTLMHCLGGLDMPTSGEVIIDGVNLCACCPEKYRSADAVSGEVMELLHRIHHFNQFTMSLLFCVILY